MTKIFFSIVLLCLSIGSSLAQSNVFRARVVDAETGEAMPYVNVLSDAGRGVVTNLEGDFVITSDLEDSIRFSFVGYKSFKVRASQLTRIVQMQPLAVSVKGVTVMSDVSILLNTFKQLRKDYRQFKDESSPYFNRITVKSGDQTEIVEDFLHARSAIGLRHFGLFSGEYWGMTGQGDSIQSSLEHTDLHHILSIGPMMPGNSSMNGYLLPFPKNCSASYFKRFYEISSEVLDDGKKLIYCVHLRKKDPKQMELLTGDIYIDSETFRLLRFDGNIDLRLQVKRGNENITIYEQIPGTLKLHVNYKEDKGFTEVSDMSYQFLVDNLHVRSVLFNVEDYQFPLQDPVPIRGNILTAINKTKRSSTFVKEQNLIKRTEEEETFIQRMSVRRTDFLPIKDYIQKAMNFNKVVPQEKVYLHFDNTGYFENETLWFKAYVTRTDNGKPTDLSKVLYVELLDPSGDVLETQKYPIDSLGQSHGEMKLDTLFGSGFYEVRAYTRYMTNWGVNAVFSRVFPIFNAPAEEGKYDDLTIKTRLYKHRDPNNRDRSDSLYLNAIDEGIHSNDLLKTVSVQFYPEGGHLVRGKKSRVALLAVDDNGNPYSGEGFVLNEAGDVLASVHTDSLGRGLFNVTPDGSPLSFQMRNLEKSDRKAFQNFSLPEAREEGCALSLDAVSDSMSATLQCTPGLCGSLIGYALMHDGSITYCDTAVARPLIEIDLDRQKMADGVSQLTVFDSKGEILAERLFFVCPDADTSDSIRIVEKTGRLKPCGKVELELQAQPNASLSFSAMDAQTMTNGSQGNMQTWMLLSSEVRGYIHNVGYYFEADDEAHRRSADLLMLTQGWRRYDWELMTGQKDFEKAQPIEDKFYVFGKLNVYRKKNPVNDVKLEAFLYNHEGQSLTGETVTDADGNYAFALPFMDGEWKMQIYTKKKNKKGKEKRETYYVGIDRQFSPRARYITPQEAEILHPLKANAFLPSPEADFPDEDEDEFIPITKKDHVLQNVTVKAKRRYFTNDDWKYKNEAWGRQFATLHYDIDKELDAILDRGEAEPTLFQFLCRKNALFNNPEAKNLPYPRDTLYTDESDKHFIIEGKLSYANRPIKWIVDNGETSVALDLEGIDNILLKDTEKVLSSPVNLVEYGNDEKFAAVTSNVGAIMDLLFPIYMSDIKSVFIVPESKKETSGAVRIYLYTHQKLPTESQKGVRSTHFQGFNKPSTFQMEDYSIIPPMADFRRTIYWNPNVKTDAQGKAKVEFFNNSTCQEMYISVEGMTEDGKVLVNE